MKRPLMAPSIAIGEAADVLRAMGEIEPRDELVPGPVRLDYWSLTFLLRCSGSDADRSFFVKIPKSQALASSPEGALDEQSRSLGRAEFETQRGLWAFAQTHGLTAVRPLAYLDRSNAILTNFVPSEALEKICRQAMLRSWRHSDDPALGALMATGAWLRKFHDAQEATAQDLELEVKSEALRRFEDLSDRSAAPGLVRALRDQLRAVPIEPGSWRTVASLPEFQVRNIMVGADGIYPVDTDEPRPRPAEADLARFVISLHMLFWGSPLFLVRPRANRQLVQWFLDGYGRPDFGSTGLDRWLLVSEWLRQWQDAYFVLDRIKTYREPLRSLVGRIYIDRPFSATGQAFLSHAG